MSDLTIGVIKLAAGLLRLRPYDDDPENDEILRQSAIQLRQQKDCIKELNAENARLKASCKTQVQEVMESSFSQHLMSENTTLKAKLARIEAVDEEPPSAQCMGYNEDYLEGWFDCLQHVKKALEKGDG